MRTTARTSLYVIPNKKNVMSLQIRIRAGTSYYYNGISYYYSPNKIILKPQQLIIIAGTSLYVISIKQNKMTEQIRTTVKTRSYYSQNKFVGHLEQKQM
jgi:hypothetical protein